MKIKNIISKLFLIFTLFGCSSETPRLNNSGGSGPVTCNGLNCVAVGFYETDPISGNLFPLIVQSRDGGKTFSASSKVPLPVGGVLGILYNVACFSSQCLAVGSYQTSPTSNSLPLVIQSFDGGKTFSNAITVSLPSGAIAGEINSITCTNKICLAVGYFQPSLTENALPLIVQSFDNGKTFADIVPISLAPSGVLGSSLLGVTCVNQECIAVGFYGTNHLNPLIVQSSDGGMTFSKPIIPSLPPDGVTGQLVGIACTEKICNAVGFYQQTITPTPPVHPLLYMIQSFDAGKTFTKPVAPIFPTGGIVGSFSNIDCENLRCIVTGVYQTTFPTGIFKPLIMYSLDGGKTFANPTESSLPTEADQGGGLSGVTCMGPQCIAVGAYETSLTTPYRLPLISKSIDGGITFPVATQAPLPTDGVFGVLGIFLLLTFF